MSQDPDYLALWKNGTDLFTALSHLAGEIGEMAGLDTLFERADRPDLRERIRKAARKVDSLLQEDRFHVVLGFTWQALVFGLPDEAPECRYATALDAIVAAVESLLLEITHGRGERHADYWPGKTKEFHRLTRELESALELFEGTPAVKEELLRRAREESQPGTPAEPTATAAGSLARKSGRMEAFEVLDAESGALLVFDPRDTQQWGPVHEGEDWDPIEEIHRIGLRITLYWHADGHWTLVTERTHWEAGYPGPPDAHRLGDADAADWLVRHGFDPPSDVAHLAGGSFFKPGTPAPQPPLEQSLIDRTDPAGNQHDDAPRSGKQSARNRGRLTVDRIANQAVLDGQPYSLTADGALLLDSLLKADGDWVAGKSLDMRAERVKKSLPKPFRDLIESSPGKGHRIPRNVLAQPCQNGGAATPE